MILNPQESSIDVAIEYRFDTDPHFVSRHLMRDHIGALADPEYAQINNVDGLPALRGLTLIETERRLTSWKSLISDFGWAKDQRFLTVGYSLQAFEAAALGLGVALGNRMNAEGMLASGRLCVPFGGPRSRHSSVGSRASSAAERGNPNPRAVPARPAAELHRCRSQASRNERER